MSKNTRHVEKMKKKRALKETKRTKYASLAGSSKKAKRQQAASRKNATKTVKHAHAMANCGNVGCTRCFPTEGIVSYE